MPAIEEYGYKDSSIRRIFVRPSRLKNFAETKEKIKAGKNEAAFVQVSMRDPVCPLFCDWLEDMGFFFVGVEPLLKVDDSIIYTTGNLHSVGEY